MPKTISLFFFSSSLKWSVDLADAMELSLMLFLLMTEPEFYIKACSS